MSQQTTNMLDLFCEMYGITPEQKTQIARLMNMAYHEGKLEILKNKNNNE